jgi:hypothetical protein
MPSAKLLAAAAAGAFLFAAQADAAAVFRSEAKLASPAAQPVSATISGAAWRCEGDACVGERTIATLDSPMRECRKVAATLGALSAFTSDGQKFDAGDLKACNVAAKTAGAATTGK